jgi:hypothetical protein
LQCERFLQRCKHELIGKNKMLFQKVPVCQESFSL